MKIRDKIWPIAILAIVLSSCTGSNKQNSGDEEKVKAKANTLGSIERLDPKVDDLISSDATIEILAEGFTWAEGPVWSDSLNAVLYTDVPENTIYKWSEASGNEVYLKPSGFTGYAPTSRSTGANGLILDAEGKLVMCQHGDRRVARMEAPLSNPDTSFSTLVDRFEDKRLNSPNDLILSSAGDYYFTDPPYGLAGQDEDSLKEQAHNGVYKLSASGELTLLTDELTRPNGLALSKDEKTLYVANSDPKKALWMAYDVTEDGVENGRVLLDVTSMIGDERKGLPDGLKVNQEGILFATGPGGVLIISPEGKHLGTIMTELATANCAFNSDETILYMTTDDYLTRIKL